MTKHIVSSNTIPAEWFDKFCTDEDAVKLFHVERNNLLEERMEVVEIAVEKETERLREQIMFAQNLVDDLSHLLHNTGSLRDFKAAFKRVVSDSMFEL